MTNQSKKRKFLASTLTATMVAAAVAPVAGVAAADNGSFPDVPADHDYAGVIADMVNADIIEGLPNGNFDLGGTITRAQAAQMVAGLLDLATGEEGNRTSFEDVKSDVWYTGAVNSLVAEGIVAGKTATLFAPGADITRGELAQLLVEAYGLADVNVDDVELPFTDVDEKAWFAKPIKILYSQNLIKGQTATKFGPKDNMKRGDFAWLAANVDYVHGEKLPKPAPAEIAVESVSAINAKTLAVEFNADLSAAELEELSFTVKRNGVNTIFELDKVEGNTVTLVRATGADLLAGTYEVTVGGLAEGQNATATVEVTAQTLTDIEIAAEYLLTDSVQSNLGITPLDQYGEELDVENANDYVITVKNITKNLPTENAQWDNENDYFFVDTRGVNVSGERYYDFGDEVRVTAVHNNTGVSTTKVLTVNEAATLASVKFGKVELPEGVERLSRDVEEVRIPYEAKDQYGNDVELTPGLVTLGSSNSDILNTNAVDFDEDEDGNKYIVINNFEQKYGDVVLRLISNQTGEVFNLELEVLQVAGEVHGVELGQTELDIAQYDTAAKTVDLTVTDSYGEEIEYKDYSTEEFTINTSNNSVAEANIVTPGMVGSNGIKASDIGKLWVNGYGEEGDTAQITVTVNATGETATLNVSIGEEQEASTIVVDEDSKHKTSLINGADTTVNFSVLDQYDNDALASGDYTVEYEIKNKREEIVLSNENNDITEPAVTVTAEKAGTATLVAKLVKFAGDEDKEEVVDEIEVNFTVAPNVTDDFTFEVEDIPTLYNAGAADDVYAEAIKLSATNEAGQEFEIPSSSILSIASSDENVKTDKDNGWVVFANGVEFDEDENEKTVTLTIVFNAENEVTTITKDVVVSNEALKATAVELYDTAQENGKLDKDAKAVSAITVENFDLLNEEEAFAVVKDQFGGYETADAATHADVTAEIVSAKGIEFTSDSAVTLGENGALDFATLEGTLADAEETEVSFRVLITTTNTKTAFVDVTVKDGSTIPSVEVPVEPEDFHLANATYKDFSSNDEEVDGLSVVLGMDSTNENYFGDVLPAGTKISLFAADGTGLGTNVLKNDQNIVRDGQAQNGLTTTFMYHGNDVPTAISDYWETTTYSAFNTDVTPAKITVEFTAENGVKYAKTVVLTEQE